MPLQVYRSGGVALNFRNGGSETPEWWLSFSGQVAQNGPVRNIHMTGVSLETAMSVGSACCSCDAFSISIDFVLDVASGYFIPV